VLTNFPKNKKYGKRTDKFIIKYKISNNVPSYIQKKLENVPTTVSKNWKFRKMCWRSSLKFKKYDKCNDKNFKQK